MSDYKGTMDLDNVAGGLSVRVLPAYLRARRDDERGAPTHIALNQKLYTEVTKLVEARQINVKGQDGKPILPDNKIFNLELVYDDTLAYDAWELRWGA